MRQICEQHLIQRIDHVTKVERGAAVLVDLMEDVVAEQLQNVSVARFGPARVHVKPVISVQIRGRMRAGNAKECFESACS